MLLHGLFIARKCLRPVCNHCIGTQLPLLARWLLLPFFPTSRQGGGGGGGVRTGCNVLGGTLREIRTGCDVVRSLREIRTGCDVVRSLREIITGSDVLGGTLREIRTHNDMVSETGLLPPIRKCCINEHNCCMLAATDHTMRLQCGSWENVYKGKGEILTGRSRTR